MALEILAVVVTPLNEMGKCLFGALKRQINYLTSYHVNIENLGNKVVQLKVKRTDVRRRVEAAECRRNVLSEEVKKWQQNIERIIEDDMRNFEEEVNNNKACLKGLCPDLISRLKLSKKAARILEDINSLLQQQEYFTEASIAHCPPAAPVELVHSSSIFEDLSLRAKVIKDVMEALGNDSIMSIALHGMGGIGKTFLVDKINNELKGSQLFKKIIKVVVSKEPYLNLIQDFIADRLRLDLKGESSTEVRANRLVERLKEEESVLIILDDLWEALDVVAIGIPGGSEHIGCKIMLTTRSLSICKQMKIQKIIKLEPLSEDESWVLFERKVGDVVRLPNLEPIAQEIVRRCKGSPLAIATLGSTLTSVDEVYVWKDALEVLKNPTRSGLQGIMPEVVESISFSYNRLHCREIKLCFLFCCLFPEDHNIDLLELRDYGVGERFLNVNALEVASNQFLSFIKKLKDCSLLLEGDQASTVKMHDVVRDIAIAIASDDENGFLVNVGRPLRTLQETEKLKRYMRMSFMKNENLVLPDPPLECPQLCSLLIKENASVSNEENCFEGMKLLRVLDVSMTDASHKKFATLPSLRCLSNLRTLYLVRCDLSNKVSLLGGLRKLEILRLCWSEIGRLPEEIGNLSNLTCLDLTNATLSIMAPNVISRLTKLEELYMSRKYRDWDQVGNASLAEVASLKHLSILTIGIQVETPHDMQFHWWNNLKEFRVMIGWVSSYNLQPSLSYDSSSSSSILAICGVNPLEHWVSNLLCIRKVRDLMLENCAGITNVGVVGGLKHLEGLIVTSCDDVEYVFGTEESQRRGELRSLILWKLPKLTSIWKGVVPIGSLQHLKEVTVSKCDSLEYLSSYSSAVALESVETVDIFKCDRMKKLVGSNREKGGVGATSSYSYSSKFTISPPPPTFPNLQSLHISECGNLKSLFSFTMARNLKQLRMLRVEYCKNLEEIIAEEEEEEKVEHRDFFQGSLPIHCPLKTIVVSECPNLKKLPIQPQIFSTLETLYGTTEWFEGLEWEDETLRSLIQEKFKGKSILFFISNVGSKQNVGRPVIHIKLLFLCPCNFVFSLSVEDVRRLLVR